MNARPAIIEAIPIKSWVVRFTDGSTYVRTGPDSWMQWMGESEEPVRGTDWLEAAWREWSNGN